MTGLFATVLISLTLIIASVSDAEARRFGAGRSFGGKSSYGSPFKRSAKSTAARSASQQKAHNQNQSARQSMSRRGGLMGMLGGLALGGLLGSMFFGGAFEGINFMDILMFGGIGYLLFRLFAAKAGAGRRGSAYSSDGYSSQQTQSQYTPEPFGGTAQQKAGFDTDMLFNKDKKYKETFQQPSDQIDADFEENIIPAGFDEDDFLAGAKTAYEDLQKAWDNRDLADIRGLTTDKVFAEIQDQLKESAETNHTDVLKIDAELLSVREIGSELEAVVLFDSIIREEVNAQAEQIREVWHFIKPKNSIQPKWYLDGIQQLEQ